MRRLKLIPILSLPESWVRVSGKSELLDTFLRQLQEFLLAENQRMTLHLSGEVVRHLVKYWPRQVGWMRDLLKDGKLEILSGGYHNALFPLFPEALRQRQWSLSREQLFSHFAYRPRGFFVPQMAWEVSLVPGLVQQGFDYAFLPDTDFSDALSQPLPQESWRTVEEDGSVLRLVPIQSSMSRAWSQGNSVDWLQQLLSAPENPFGWVILSHLQSGNWLQPLQEVLAEAQARDLEIQTWTVGRVMDTSRSGGPISMISALGWSAGMPQSVRSCRELLHRRPEASLIRNKLLHIHRKASQELNAAEAKLVDSELLPIMDAEYYLNQPAPMGILGLENRSKAFEQLSKADRLLDELSKREMRLEVMDYLGDSTRQILAATPDLNLLVDFRRGGVLRELNYRPKHMNWLLGRRDDGEPAVAFQDHLLAPELHTLHAVHNAIEDGAMRLLAPYDYQIKRQSDRIQLLLSAEQGGMVGDRMHSLRVEKIFGFKLRDAELQASWQLTNAMFHVARCRFATECMISFPTHAPKRQVILIDGKRIGWEEFPIQRLAVQSLVFLDRDKGTRVVLESLKSATVIVAPVYAGSGGAAPDDLQGFRFALMWDVDLKGQESLALHVRLRFSKRRFPL